MKGLLGGRGGNFCGGIRKIEIRPHIDLGVGLVEGVWFCELEAWTEDRCWCVYCSVDCL